MASFSSAKEHGTKTIETEVNNSWWPLVAIVTAVSLLMMSATIVAVALPDIQRDLNADLTDLQWIINSFTLAMAVFQLVAGTLGDRYGRRRTFIIGMVLFALASLACGLATTPGLLIAARTAQGLAGAIMFATSLALVAQCYSGQKRGLAFGVRGAVAGVAVALGPLLGGALIAAVNWRWVFFINLPFAVITIAIAMAKLPRHEELRRGQRLDFGGLITFTGSLVLLMLALLQGNDHGWTSTRILTMFGGSALLLVIFLIIETRHPEPMLKLTLFRNRSFTGTQLATVATHGSFFALLVYLSLFLQNDLGYSAFKTGLCFLAVNIPILLMGPVAGGFMDKLPAWLLPALGLLFVGGGLLVMHRLNNDSSWTDLAVGMAIVGLGLGMTLPALGSLSMEVADQQYLGMAAGTNNTFSQAGMAIGVAVYGALLENEITASMTQSLGGTGAPVEDLAHAAANGQIAQVLPHLPEQYRDTVVQAAHQAFVTGLNHLFLIAAAVAFAGLVLAVTLIRQRVTTRV
ncbi:MFS transporter [Paractinoplanes toevensis]|uniref:MFS transporter n=1 Tax=Paractinoplanes toevensis TaxID=571911 RepID=A0A919TEJ3_9ACTN|nr:MFS transporter [Actinoplanes toevensis]GIM92621.1 MFS transporter [Actinoplanes toevensis]